MIMKGTDKILLGIVLVLVFSGFLIFSSASLGLLARSGASYSSVAFSQILFGIVGGLSAMVLMSQIYYRNLRQYAFYIFLFTIFLSLLVFVPGIGIEHGGAHRWIGLGGFSFQTSELLKIGFIVYLATWLSGTSKVTHTFKHGTLPFLAITSIVGVLMLLQPDTDTFLMMGAAGCAMFLVAGGRWRDIGGMALGAILLLAILVAFRPYLMDRITGFIDPSSDLQGSNYQVQQSLIAVGSGGMFGRGFGQSIQKFDFLPEPIGDSIFAVFAEEFGFFGSLILVVLMTSFIARGYRIASHAKDQFGMLLVIGFITLIAMQTFLNIAAMTAMAPMLGLPLPFISHGGTALLSMLATVGIILNVSKYQKQKV